MRIDFTAVNLLLAH